eukprot:5856127-Prymnesium_polylepis.1
MHAPGKYPRNVPISVDSLDVATMMADKWQAHADAAAAHIQRHARGWAAREFFCGRLLSRYVATVADALRR